MSTVKDLLQTGELIQFAPKLDPNELVQRRVFLTRQAYDWCFSSDELGYPAPNPKQYGSLFAALNDFVKGVHFQPGIDIKRLQPKTDDIWELKTTPPDAVRAFGWFDTTNNFVVSHCEFKAVVMKTGYENEVNKVRDVQVEFGIGDNDKMKWDRNDTRYFSL